MAEPIANGYAASIPVLVSGHSNCSSDWSIVTKKSNRCSKAVPPPQVLLVGDAGIRGVIAGINKSTGGTAEAAIRDGRLFSDAARDVKKDSDRIGSKSHMVVGYGQRDLDNVLVCEAKSGLDTLIKELEGTTAEVGLLTIPPQVDVRKEEKARELNRYMYQRCRNSKVHVIDCNLDMYDVARDSVHLNFKGKAKVAKAIKAFLRVTKNSV